MKKSDFGVITFIYLFCGFFFYQNSLLPVEAQSYPGFLLSAIAFLNTLYLGFAFIKWKANHEIEDDIHEMLKGFIPSQFFTVLLGCGVYVVLLYTVGYYIASILYLALALYLLKVKVKWIALVIVTLLVVIYIVFSLFLKVPLPVGSLFY